MNHPYNLQDVLADIDEHMAEEQFLNERLNDLIQWLEEQTGRDSFD